MNFNDLFFNGEIFLYRSDTDLRVSLITYTLSPKAPVIAKTAIPPTYNFKKSLHYLRPEVIRYKVSIDDNDYLLTEQAILNQDAEQFLVLLDKYSQLETLENFIIKLIVSLKRDLSGATQIVLGLVNSIGK